MQSQNQEGEEMNEIDLQTPCPGCGSPFNNFNITFWHYECGARLHFNGMLIRTPLCFANARINRLETELNAERSKK